MRILFYIFSLLVLCLGSVYAARPMVADDARVVDPRSCQLETWGVYSLSDSVGEYWAIPGCNLFYDVEISFGGMASNAPFEGDKNIQEGIQGVVQKGSFQAQQMILGAKRVFGDLDSEGFAYGLVIGNAYNFKGSKYRFDHYVYAPLSVAFMDNTLLLHANVGYKLESKEAHIYNVSLGFEKQLNARLWGIGEGFYERLDRAKYQVGLRVWLVMNKLQLDGTYGNAFVGREGFFTLGLRYLGDPLW